MMTKKTVEMMNFGVDNHMYERRKLQFYENTKH